MFNDLFPDSAADTQVKTHVFDGDEVLQLTKKVLQLTSLTPPWSLLSAAHILDVIFPGTRFQSSISFWQLGFLSEGALSPTPS